MLHSSFLTPAIASTVGLFIAILVLLETGRKIGMGDYAKHLENTAGHGLLQGVVFSLMGLVIAFSFEGAGARFDRRRYLLVDETNAIGTAYLRLSLLPAAAQPKLRDTFRQYLDARLEFYRSWPDSIAAARAARERADIFQKEIWNQAVEATRGMSREPNANAATLLVIQSLNEMIDNATTSMAALQFHPPAPLYWTLVALVFACSLMAGYETACRKTRSWVHILGFAVIVAGSILLILDAEFPRAGLIRVDPLDQALVDLRTGMQ
jgi:hypothetical protein